MKKKFVQSKVWLTSTLILAILLSGCQTNSSPDTSPTDVSADQEKATETTERIYDESTLVWTIPDYAGGLRDRLAGLNKKLAEDGFSCTVVFETLESDDYNALLCQKLEKGTTDIAFLGTDISGACVDVSVADVIRAGNVKEISSYLQSDAGKGLYEAYPEEIWRAARVDGEQFFVPSEATSYGMTYYAFNSAFFSESDINQFDGSMESLVSLVREKVPASVSYPLLWNCSAENIANLYGYQNYGYAFASLDTGKVYNPLEIDEIQQFVELCDEAVNESLLYSVDLETQIEIEAKRDFGVIAFTSGDSNINETTEDILLAPSTYALWTMTSAGTGICANSDKKDQAFELLARLHTDPEYANLLVWGEEDVDYQLKDGYVYDMEGNVTFKFLMGIITGVYDLAYPTEISFFPVETKKQKEAFIASDNLRDNILIGFIPEFKNRDVDYEGLMNLLYFCLTPSETVYVNENSNLSLDKTDYENPEDWLEKANEYYELLGGNEVVNELNRQIEEWMQ